MFLFLSTGDTNKDGIITPGERKIDRLNGIIFGAIGLVLIVVGLLRRKFVDRDKS